MASMTPMIKDEASASHPRHLRVATDFYIPHSAFRTVSFLNRLETKFGHWAIPGLTTYIAIGSALTFMLWKMRPDFMGTLMMWPPNILHGEVWRLFTYMFVPQVCSLLPMPDWINAAFYVLFLIWVGNGLDRAWGAFRTNLFCLVSWVSITIAAFFFGAFYAQLLWAESLFFAYARFYGDEVIYAFYVLPAKVRWLSWALAAWLIYQALRDGPVFQASLIAVVFNYFLFFARDIVAEAKLRHQVGERRARFDREIRTSADEAMHRCHVCGRTEQTTPDLEFRVAADGEEYCAEHLPKKP